MIAGTNNLQEQINVHDMADKTVKNMSAAPKTECLCECLFQPSLAKQGEGYFHRIMSFAMIVFYF